MPQKEPSTPNSQFLIYKVECDPELIEVLQALIQIDLEVEGIYENPAGFDCYFDTSIETALIDSKFDDLQDRFAIAYTIEKMANKNWNAIWESNFQPVEVDKYCRIRAPFHPKSDEFQHDIVIHPGMAFGTGHHETTSMIVGQMQHMNLEGKRVLDAGCGTGVLAILAALEGAKDIDAFDFDIHSVESTIENRVLNDVEHIKVFHSDVDSYDGEEYDCILANINRNVILEHISGLCDMLATKGMIIVSGYLEEDTHLILSSTRKLGLELIKTSQKRDWMCQQFIKS